MKISVAQINYHVGNFELNSKLIIDAIGRAKKDGSDLVLFSELSLTAYPPHDLLEHKDFIERCNKYINKIAASCTGISAIIGAPTINKGDSGKKLFNSALVLSDGKIAASINKGLLPTYDIFDEYRYFEPAKTFKTISINKKRIAVTICEDLWDEQEFDPEFSTNRMYSISPMDELAKEKPELILNLSASPFSASRTEMRNRVFTEKAAKHKLPIIVCNQVGANTELIFEGGSMVINPSGEIYDSLNSFEPDFRTYRLEDIINSEPVQSPGGDKRIQLIYDALVLGTRDYFSKMNFRSAILGLSGGIDSAVSLAIAGDALGSDNIRVLLLPSMYSSRHSVDDAITMADKLGVEYDIINISDTYYQACKSLENVFADKEEDVSEENIQARLRAVFLMAVSNKFGNILLNTSNKSEAAVGYGTLYGDMAGGLSILGDVYKTDVYKLATYINRNQEIIPGNTISKAPSAELRPDQKDTDSLPDYNILDSILYQYIELQKPPGEISGRGIKQELVSEVIRLINNNEYKRYQAPPILRISSKAFGLGRRMPLVARY
jgi:NAD+ synthase (glutamine-hydrolysing)